MTEPPFPEPLEDDDDDVAWALQTAKVQWNRGGEADAIVWLRRAVDSADQIGNVWRANDLRRMADDLAANLGRPRPPPTSQAPLSVGGSDIDDLLGEPDSEGASGVTSIPPPGVSGTAHASYASIDDFDVEDIEVDAEIEDEPFDEEVVVGDDDAPNPRLDQLLGSAVELTEEVEALDEEAPEAETVEVEALEEDDELEADVIPDDALMLDDDDAEDVDEPVTKPQLDDPRFLDIPHRSPLPPPRGGHPSPTTAPGIGPDPILTPPPPPVVVPVPLTVPALSLPPQIEEDPRLGDVLLGEVRGLEDVPPDGQAILARDAVIERLNAQEEVSSFGLALVLRGAVNVMPAIADLSCARAAKGEMVWSEGNLEEGIALRLVASEDSTEVAVWDAALLKNIVREYPWVLEDLKTLADRFQALAGVSMGPMGERLDDSLRAMVAERCEIKRLLPGEALTTKGKPVGGMYIMAAGRIEIVDGEAVESEVGPGDFLFAPQVLSNGKAPNDSRAGKGGALVLFASRGVAHDLLLSVPPLLEIFAS